MEVMVRTRESPILQRRLTKRRIRFDSIRFEPRSDQGLCHGGVLFKLQRYVFIPSVLDLNWIAIIKS